MALLDSLFPPLKRQLPCINRLLIVFCVTCSFWVNLLYAQEVPVSQNLRGRVVQHTDSSAISNVNIINLTQARGTSSGADGYFTISAQPGDSILFRAVGFWSETIGVDGVLLQLPDLLKVELREQVYELPRVDVYPYATFTDFKYAFLNFKDPEPPMELNLPRVFHSPFPDGGGGIVVPGPITALYDHFSRRGREMQKYRQVVARDELRRRASRVVNAELVMRVTGIQDEREVYEFLDYCQFTDEYIVSRKEYEVYEALLACYERYSLSKE